MNIMKSFLKDKKIIYGILTILLLSFLVSGCSSGYKSQSTDQSFNEYQDMDMVSDSDFEDTVSSEEMEYDGEFVQPDKIITTISINMQTKDFMKATEELNALLKKHKGYIEESNISYNNYVYQDRLMYSDYSLRVPKENLEIFVRELKEIGNVIFENKNKQDITNQYRDTESRLRIIETKEERILALLEEAENMEDIITLENQLSDIIYEKESLTSSIISMDDKVDYGTVYFQLEEVAKFSPGENARTPFMEKIKNAFQDSIYFFLNTIQKLVIVFIYLLPYLLILVVLLLIALAIKKRVDKKMLDRENHLDGKDKSNK